MKKTGKQYADEHIASLGMVRVTDLKKGEKFYSMDWDDIRVFELVSLTIIHGEKDVFEYVRRVVGTKTEEHIKIQGTGVVPRSVVLRYNGRDRGSFVAGFKSAMRLYQKHMQIFDRENAGLDNFYNIAMAMNQEYHNWMKGN